MPKTTKSIHREIELESRFFIKSNEVDEWDWLLDMLGIPEADRENIDSIKLTVDEMEYEEES